MKLIKVNGLRAGEIKALLKHVYFINGTAYAGKSTVCKMLAAKYDMVHCEENFDLGPIMDKTSPTTHPNLHYFKTMGSWEEFVTRDKYTYTKWLDDTAEELTYLEIEFLLTLPNDRLVIVDTNITPEVLKEISDYDRVAFMVTTPEISRDEFFNRLDPEKQFLLDVIKKTDHPEETLKNFKEMLYYANRPEVIERFTKSGFFYTKREAIEEDIHEKFIQVSKHFNIESKMRL